MIKKIFITCIAILIFVSCTSNYKKVNKFKDGVTKSIYFYNKSENLDSVHFFYPSGRLKQILNYDASKNDSFNYVINFDSLGNKKSEGYYLDKNLNNKIGQWKIISDSKYDSFVEYVIFDNQSIVNQIWVTDKKNNDTIIGKGNYFFIDNRNEVLSDEFVEFRFYLFEPYFNYNTEMMVVLVDEDKINKDFSEIFHVERDTIPSLKNDGINHQEIPVDIPENHFVAFRTKFKTPGTKKISGYISEYYLEDGDTSEIIERRLFFCKNIIVKDKK